MGSYYRHTRSEKAEVPYSFQCEHCGKDTGRLRAVIEGPEASDNSNFKTLNADRERKLCERAHTNLVNELKKLHKNATEKNIISTKFSDLCPNCHQPQSWAVSGLKNKMFENPIVCLIVGAIFGVIAVVAHYYGDMEYVTLPMAAGIFGAGVVAAAGCLIYNVIKIQSKTKKTATAMHNLPKIEWSAVSKLLEEQ